VTNSRSNIPTPKDKNKTVVLGVGNLLLSDEGIGVHVVNRLLKMALPPGVEVIEGGVDGLGLMSVVTTAERLIVVDAVKGGGPPGSIYRFDPEDIKSHPKFSKVSMHEIGILEVIRLSKLVGQIPKTTVIGIEPKSLNMGMELSPEIEAKVPRIIELIFDELKASPLEAAKEPV
jgi:hydrogenase maturation protease